MNDILQILYTNCDPMKPAEAGFYVDLSEVRGGETFIGKMCGKLNLATDGKVCALFAGHFGSGKSSELEHLAHELRREIPKKSHKRYFPVVVNVLDYVDMNDASVAEILLAIVAEIAAELKAKEGIELKDTYLQKRFNEIRRTLLGDVELKEAEIPLWLAKVKINLRLADASTRDAVRNRLHPQMTSLIGEINLFLTNVRTQLRSKKPKQGEVYYDDIVLIVDSIDRILRVANQKENEDAHHAIFIEGAEQLTTLDAHRIYTVPLKLVRELGEELTMRYGNNVFVLPNVKTEKRGTHAQWEKGRDRLKELIEARLPGYRLTQAFAEDALEYLLSYCGGHVRQLMTFMREAALYAEDVTPITLAVARKAIRPTVQSYGTSLRQPHWKLLAELERDPEQQLDTNDAEKRKLLDLLSVLEYVNGGEDEESLDEAVPWYAVHPIVRELRLFKDALAQLDAANAATGKPMP